MSMVFDILMVRSARKMRAIVRGHYEVNVMPNTDRQAMIDRDAAGPAELRAAFNEAPVEALTWTPIGACVPSHRERPRINCGTHRLVR